MEIVLWVVALGEDSCRYVIFWWFKVIQRAGSDVRVTSGSSLMRSQAFSLDS